MTAITDKKLRDKTLKEKKGELKKTTKIIKQNTYEKKNNKDTMPEASISNKKKTKITKNRSKDLMDLNETDK